MVGFMNAEALDQTRSTGFVHFWSRSRQELWKKGETSGHVQEVEQIRVNCELQLPADRGAPGGRGLSRRLSHLLLSPLEPDNSLTTIRDRWFDPADVYGERLRHRRPHPPLVGRLRNVAGPDLESRSGTSRLLRDRRRPRDKPASPTSCGNLPARSMARTATSISSNPMSRSKVARSATGSPFAASVRD